MSDKNGQSFDLQPFYAPPEHAAVEQVAAQLLADCLAEHTRRAYASDWNRWRDFCLQHRIPLHDPLVVHTIAFREYLKREYASSTAARVLATLAYFYRAFQASGLTSRNPFDRSVLKHPRMSDVNKTRAIDPGDAAKMLAITQADGTLEGLRDHAILQLLYTTGMRCASVQSIQRSGLERGQDGRLRLRIIVKGNKEKMVTLTPEADQALLQWLAVVPTSTPHVFPKREDLQQPLSTSTIWRVVTKRAKQAGISHVHPHCFRAAFITAAYDAHVYERDIQAAAHHADASTTRRYDRGSRGDDVTTLVEKFRRGGV